MIRRAFLGLFIFFSTIAVMNSAVLALDPFVEACRDTPDASVCQQQSAANPISGQDGVLLRATKLITFVVGVASVIMIIFGGIKYVLSQGDSNSVSNAKNTILYALIGLAVAVFSQGIIVFVINRI